MLHYDIFEEKARILTDYSIEDMKVVTRNIKLNMKKNFNIKSRYREKMKEIINDITIYCI